jgi:RNA polymerase sigma-70 factor (ECF subfamily)
MRWILSESTDEELMLKIQLGDQKACEELVDKHLLPLARFATRMLGSRSMAEDATQETFLKVWSNAHQWRSGKAKVSTWLHTIAHNICIDQIRKDKSPLQETWSDDHNTDGQLDDDRSAMSKQIFSALNLLAESQRTAIVLCYYQGLSNKDAAQVIGVSVPALESLLARGRRSLKKVLLPVEEAN